MGEKKRKNQNPRLDYDKFEIGKPKNKDQWWVEYTIKLIMQYPEYAYHKLLEIRYYNNSLGEKILVRMEEKISKEDLYFTIHIDEIRKNQIFTNNPITQVLQQMFGLIPFHELKPTLGIPKIIGVPK